MKIQRAKHVLAGGFDSGMPIMEQKEDGISAGMDVGMRLP